MRHVFLLLIGGVWIAGCAGSPLDALDAEAARMIRQRQALALGVAGQVPLNLEPADPPTDKSTYREDPSTLNPPAGALPAKTATPTDADQILTRGRSSGLDESRPPLRLDLKGLLAYALERSPEYRSRKEDLYLATLSLIIERHLWGPRFFNTLTASVSDAQVSPLEGGERQTVATLINDFQITQRLPYGGEVSVGALVEYVNLLRRAAINADDSRHAQSIALTASLNLPLLRGAGQVAREDLIQAERDLVYAVRAFERFRREFLVDLSVDYFNLIVRQKQIANRAQQVKNLQRLADRFEALAGAGREPYFEAERSLGSVLIERSNLLNDQDAYQERLDTLKIRIGMPTVEPLAIEEINLTVPDPALDSVHGVLVASQFRLDLQTSEDRVIDARRGIANARNGLLPDLDLFGNVTLPTDGNTAVDGVDFEAGELDVSGGVTFSLPLDRKIEEVTLRQAMIAYERSRRNTQVLSNQVALQVRQSIRRIDRAKINFVLQQRNVSIAERRKIAVTLRERSLGPRDVIEAEQALVDAQDRRDQAQRDLRVSVLQYLLDTGQMRVSPEGRWEPPAQLVGGVQ